MRRRELTVNEDIKVSRALGKSKGASGDLVDYGSVRTKPLAK